MRQTMIMCASKMVPPEQIDLFKEAVNNLSDVGIAKMVGEETIPINGTIDDNFILTEIDGEKVDIDLGKTIGIPMMDDSMEPLIPYKSVIKYKDLDTKLQNGNIIILNYQGSLYIRKYFEQQDKVVLIPNNIKYHPMLIKKNKINIIGVVTSYVHSL